MQRNRGPWLVEWFAFHYMIGFRKFYYYAHQCEDNTAEILLKLQKRLDITAIAVNKQGDMLQLSAYQHACDNHMDEVDWMAFIDGDEFIFPTNANTMLVPGFVSTFTTSFHQPGEALMPCHEYCGTGHEAMWARVQVISAQDFLAQSRHAERLSCVAR